MNKNKEQLDNLLSQLETFRFTIKKVEQLFKDDEAQLNKGGDYLNLEAIHIRDWDNLSDKDWYIDYQRLGVYGKEEYLKELDEIKSSIYKHYLIETYESLIKFIAPSKDGEENKAPKIDDMVKNIDLDFHNKLTPFGFNTITFLFIFSKVRNAFTHNDSIFRTEDIDLTMKKYLKHLDINQTKCQIFLKTYFNVDIDLSNPTARIIVTKAIFDQLIKFTQSYAFSLYRYCREKEHLPWKIQKESERLNIKTNKPLTVKQMKYLENTFKKNF